MGEATNAAAAPSSPRRDGWAIHNATAWWVWRGTDGTRVSAAAAEQGEEEGKGKLKVSVFYYDSIC